MISFTDPASLSHEVLEEGAVFAPHFDDKGLVTAVTVEASTGTVLMLAHMNAEALSLTLATREVHYFSRSRGKLWKKGETSGEVQKLVDIRTDWSWSSRPGAAPPATPAARPAFTAGSNSRAASRCWR